MNKRFTFFIILFFSLLLTAPVQASVQSGDVFSQTDLLNSDVLTNLGKNRIPSVMEETGYSPGILVLTDTNGKELDDFVQEIHKNVVSDTTIRLVLHVTENNEGGLDIEDYAVYADDDSLKEYILTRIAPYLTRRNWSGVLSDDINAFNHATDAYLNAVSDYSDGKVESDQSSVENDTTNSVFVVDQENVLSENGTKVLMLNNEARELSLMLNVGVYALIKNVGNDSISTFAENYYKDKELGLENEKNGMLLVIDPEQNNVTLYATDDVKDTINSKARADIVKQVNTSVKKGQLSEGIEKYLAAVKASYEENPGINWGVIFAGACIVFAAIPLIKNVQNLTKSK